jgi:hypothetical protein
MMHLPHPAVTNIESLIKIDHGAQITLSLRGLTPSLYITCQDWQKWNIASPVCIDGYHGQRSDNKQIKFIRMQLCKVCGRSLPMVVNDGQSSIDESIMVEFTGALSEPPFTSYSFTAPVSKQNLESSAKAAIMQYVGRKYEPKTCRSRFMNTRTAHPMVMFKISGAPNRCLKMYYYK